MAKELHLSDTSSLKLASAEAQAGCSFRITFETGTGKAVLYLTPDRRFLAKQLYDTESDPTAAIKSEDLRVHQMLMADPSPTRGRADAPVAIVEFADFECPYCKDFESQLAALPEGIRAKVKVVYKHMPGSEHPWARVAVGMATCAANQSNDAFWALHDFLFREQSALTVTNIQQRVHEFAGMLRVIDAPKFDACIANHSADAIIDRDMALSRRLGLTGTPSIFLNGERVPSTISTKELADRIDRLNAETQSFKN